MESTSPEPSMEDILASIKRIIAEDGDAAPRAARPSRRPIAFGGADEGDDVEEGAEPPPAKPAEDRTAPAAAHDHSDEVLELTRLADAPKRQALPEHANDPPPAGKLVSEDAAVASRQALAALSAVVLKPEHGSDNTLEGMVREMLRPVLKEWLDARLPDIVERLVAGEISRITGREL